MRITDSLPASEMKKNLKSLLAIGLFIALFQISFHILMATRPITKPLPVVVGQHIVHAGAYAMLHGNFLLRSLQRLLKEVTGFPNRTLLNGGKDR